MLSAILAFVLGSITVPLLLFVLLLLLAIGAGAWGYRYLLKRNPAKLEQWAAQINAAAARAQAKLDGK